MSICIISIAANTKREHNSRCFLAELSYNVFMLRLLLLSIISYLLVQMPIFAQEIPVSFQAVPGQPYFASNQLNVDAAEFDTLHLRLVAKEGGTARLFWANNYDPQFNQNKSIWFFLKAGRHDYYFNLPSQNPNWIGWTTGFVFMPEISPAFCEIKSAEILPSTFYTNMLSGWQEFWGPRGRLVIGSTINTIQSSNLFGQSIFIYLYWIIGVFAVGYFSWEAYKWNSLKKKPAFESVILNTGKAVFIAIIVFWGLLEISNLFNNWLLFKDDWKYVGKSYQEKLKIANSGDFYPFIIFCEQNIPANTNFDMRIPPIYNDIKAKYYLYPRQMTTLDAEYLVVYDLPAEATTIQKYTPYKIFRKNAYIMRKKHANNY